VYVDGRTDGDGSRDAPLRSIQRGLDVANRTGATVVALADGTYAEGVDFLRAHDGITLHGRCSDKVVLDATGTDRPLVMQLYAPSGSPTFGLSGLTLRGADVGGIRVLGANATLRDVRLEGLLGLGIQVEEGSDVTLEDVVITGLVPSRAYGNAAEGVRVTDDARVHATRLRVEDLPGVAVYVDGSGARATLEDITVRGITTAGRSIGVGVVADADVDVSLVRGTIETPEGGVGVSITGGRFSLDATALTGPGGGLDVRNGGAATLRDVTMLGIVGFGVHARGDGTVLEMTGVTIQDIVADANNDGRGVEVDDGARAALVDVTVEQATDVALYVGGGSVEATRTTLARTRERARGGRGRGVETNFEGEVTLRESTVADNVEVGIFVSSGSVLEMDDVDLARTTARADERRGVGLEVLDSVADVRNSRITSSELINLLVAGDSLVTLIDTELRETTGTRSGYAGWGVQVSEGAHLTMTRGGVYDSAVVGLFVTRNATADLHEVNVTGTRRTRGVRAAPGVLLNGDGTATIEGGTISDNEGPGLVCYYTDASLTGTTLLRNEYAAVTAAEDSILTLDGIRVEDTREGPDGGAFGVITKSGPRGAPRLTVHDSIIGPHAVAGIWFGGPGSLNVEDSDIAVSPGTARGATRAHGNAIFANDTTADPADLHIAGNRFHGDGGIPVVLHHATGTFDANVWETDGVDVTQQACGDLVPLPSIPDATVEACPSGNRLVDLSFLVPQIYLRDVSPDE
jgi:hypothetical protein